MSGTQKQNTISAKKETLKLTQKFSEFITEETKKQKYKLVIFPNSHEKLRDVGKQDSPDVKLMNAAAKRVGIELVNAEYS